MVEEDLCTGMILFVWLILIIYLSQWVDMCIGNILIVYILVV